MTIKFLLLLVSIASNFVVHASPLLDSVKTPAQEKKVSEKTTYIKDQYLTEFVNPWDHGDPNEMIEFRFENASLKSFIDYFAERFGITFLTDDILNPAPTGSEPAKLTSKISFTTHKPFSKKEAWGIFTSFLDLAGLTVIPGPSARVFKITPTKQDSPLAPGKNPLPLFIDTNINDLPADDTVIRYIAFIRNTSLDTIAGPNGILNDIKSTNSPRFIVVPDMRAIIMTDKSSNIKNMLAIIQELDQANPPEELKVLKLDRIDATRAVTLYKDLVKTEEPSLTARLLGQRKKSSTNYFSDTVRMTPVPHLNSIVMIGTKDAVRRAYDFIKNTLDRREDTISTPIFTYALKHTNAKQMADILTNATKFQEGTEAAKVGGVRDGDKYFRQGSINIQAEENGNRLIINADYEDYTKIFNLIKKLDVEQPQVAIKVLLLNIDLTENKQIGTQLRNKIPGVNGLLGNNVNFQTSGLAGTSSSVVENPNGTGATRLLGDLISLASLAGNVGSTLLTLGADIDGVWGIFKILEQYTKTSVVANPFLITTNKYPAQISVGQIRRVLDSNIQNGTSTSVGAFKDLAANLTVAVTPQISIDGLITLDVTVSFEQFTTPVTTDQNDPAAGNRTRKVVNTSVIMSNNEVLALGGLIQDTVQDAVTKVPILGDIPILGNLFKNVVKTYERTSLLVLILPEVIPTNSDNIADKITEDKILDTKAIFYGENKERDPLLRWFFKSNVKHGEAVIDEFVNLKDKYIDESQHSRLEKTSRLKQTESSLMHHVKESDEQPLPPKADAKKTGRVQDLSPQDNSQALQLAEARYGKIQEPSKDIPKDKGVGV